MRYLGAAVLALLALLALPAMAAPFEAISIGNAEIRSGALPTDPLLATLAAGQAIIVLDCVSLGCLVETPSGPGWVAAEALQVDGQPALFVARAARHALVGPFARQIAAEGDSYLDGAYGFALKDYLAQRLRRAVDSTAVGGSEMTALRDRLVSANAAQGTWRVTVIWDGATYGIVDAASYADLLEDGIDSLGHERFVILPPMAGPLLREVAAEFERRWPENYLDWRDSLGDFAGAIPSRYLARPETDDVHLNGLALEAVADQIAGFIRQKGW